MRKKERHRIMPAHTHHSWFRSLSFALVLASGALVAPEALAGEVKFGAEPLETNDAGDITKAGRSAAIKELKSLPGEEIWPIHVWTKIDKGAPGPLYVEFYGKVPGSNKRYRAWAYEHRGYEGEKFVSVSFELDGNDGFNRGRTYDVEVVQLDDKGKNLKLASSKVSLVFTEGEPEEEGDDEGDEGDDLSEQDELDSFTNEDEGGSDEAPPPVTPPSTKKGCSVDPGMGAAPGVLVLLMLGAGMARRRRR